MSNVLFGGLILSLLAGLLAGCYPAPIKAMRHFGYPHWALLSSLTGLLILPWSISIFSCPHAWEAYRSVPTPIVLKALLFSCAWGVANVLCGLCLVRIGFSLTLGLLAGVSLPIGVLLPLLIKGSGSFSRAPALLSRPGLLLLTGVLVLVAAVVLMTLAGFGRERALHTQGRSTGSRFVVGFIMAVIGGLLLCGLSFAFIYTQATIQQALQTHGAGEMQTSVGIWAIVLLGGSIPNLLWPLWLLNKDRSWGAFREAPLEIAFSALMGLMLFLYFVCLGAGMKRLGPLGASVGFGVYQAMQIATSQAVGIVGGEWHGVGGRPRAQMIVALALILVAIVLFAMANALLPPTQA